MGFVVFTLIGGMGREKGDKGEREGGGGGGRGRWEEAGKERSCALQ